ncbi:MAG: OsmC family protein [Crocinitomicaceae bacterium]|nr:OsmC family protein [Crocinitomicaceae bacterium]
MEQHVVNTRWKDGMHFIADAPGGMINIDAAEDIGGKGKGNRPKPLMLASLAGCTGIDMISLIKKMRIAAVVENIIVDGILADEHPKIYHTITIKYIFNASETERPKLEKAVELSFNKYCGVIAMFKSFAKVSYSIELTH